MNQRFTLSAILILVAANPFQSAIGDDALNDDERKQVIENFMTVWREKAQSDFEAGVEELRLMQKGKVWDRLDKPFAKNRRGYVFKDERTKQAEIDSMRARVLACGDKALNGLAIANFNPSEIGALVKMYIRGSRSNIQHDYFVVQVVDGENAVVRVRTLHQTYVPALGYKDVESEAWYWFKMDTKGLVDGKQFNPPEGRIFLVNGTRTYATAIGGSNTVKFVEDVTAEVPTMFTEKELNELLAEDAEDSAISKPSASELGNRAASKLRLATTLLKKNKVLGREWLQEIVDDYPMTEAAKKAAMLLE